MEPPLTLFSTTHLLSTICCLLYRHIFTEGVSRRL